MTLQCVIVFPPCVDLLLVLLGPFFVLLHDSSARWISSDCASCVFLVVAKQTKSAIGALVVEVIGSTVANEGVLDARHMVEAWLCV